MTCRVRLVRKSPTLADRHQIGLGIRTVVSDLHGGLRSVRWSPILPGLTVDQAAADPSTRLAVIVAIAAGAVVLVRSLILLFRPFLRGQLGAADDGVAAPTVPAAEPRGRRWLLASLTVITLVAGLAMTLLASGGWVPLGVGCLITCAVSTFGLVTELADSDSRIRAGELSRSAKAVG